MLFADATYTTSEWSGTEFKTLGVAVVIMILLGWAGSRLLSAGLVAQKGTWRAHLRKPGGACVALAGLAFLAAAGVLAANNGDREPSEVSALIQEQKDFRAHFSDDSGITVTYVDAGAKSFKGEIGACQIKKGYYEPKGDDFKLHVVQGKDGTVKDVVKHGSKKPLQPDRVANGKVDFADARGFLQKLPGCKP